MEEQKEYKAVVDPSQFPETLETEMLKGRSHANYRLPGDKPRAVKGKFMLKS